MIGRKNHDRASRLGNKSSSVSVATRPEFNVKRLINLALIDDKNPHVKNMIKLDGEKRQKLVRRMAECDSKSGQVYLRTLSSQ